jgi:prepilin-type N-terminal cleavage/methylation domain-containing protein
MVNRASMAFDFGKTTIHARHRGFTLVEIALVVVIASILLIAGMRLMIARAESAQIEVTRKNQDAIKTALISYLGQNNRLPCPDNTLPPLGIEVRNLNAAPTPCTTYVGTVPYASLGLDRSAVLDGWDNFITYVLSPPQVPAPTLPPLPLANPSWTTSWALTYAPIVANANIQTANGPLAFWPTVSTGAITVYDVNGNAISSPAANPPTGAVAVLISYGRNGFGAVNVTGNVNSTVGAGQDELSNANPTALGPTTFAVVNRDITDQVILNHGSFDDIVLPLRQNDFVAPLALNGTLQPSAIPVLSQANDYVIGQIASTRTLCPGPAACPCVGPANYYTLPAAVAPTQVLNGPVTYQSTGTACFMSTTIAPTPAYTLATPDGNTRQVTPAEAIATLGRLGGF